MNEEQMRAEFEDFRIRFGKAEGIKPNMFRIRKPISKNSKYCKFTYFK